MQPAVQREPEPAPESLVELPPHSRLPRLDLGVEWESRGGEFLSSLTDFFTGPRPAREPSDAPQGSVRVQFLETRWPLAGFLASCLGHAAALWILLLPIWGFLRSAQPSVRPAQMDLAWYETPVDLPHISLGGGRRKQSRQAKNSARTNPLAAAESDHPLARQTILSIPVRMTHPRQTLIRPDAPPAPPKIAPALPDIVQWPSSEKPRAPLLISPPTSAPRISRRARQNLSAPDIAISAKDAAPLRFAASRVPNPRLPTPLGAASGPSARQPATHARPGAAPEIISGSAGDPNLHRLIALSAAPAPPAPTVEAPSGNLAARIARSPAGRSSNSSRSSEGRVEKPGSASTSEIAGPLPATVAIREGNSGAPANAVAARAAAASRIPRAAAELPAAPTRGASSVSGLDPSLPPEALLSGKQVYTLHVSLPNLTSASGSWILCFAQLDQDYGPHVGRREPLSGPVPVEKADPKYPPDMIRQHVQGEVVLYAIIRKDGSVDSIQVVRGLEPELDRNAMAALALWKFRPATRDGVPVDLEAVVHIPFNYRSPEE